MGLTDAEQKFYDQNGYVLKKGLIHIRRNFPHRTRNCGLARANGRKRTRRSRDLMGRI